VPEVQEAWGRILAGTPGSRLLIHPENPNWMRRYPIAAWLDGFLKRLGKHGVGRERLIISEPTGTRQEILKRMEMGDVYLDSFPYSGPTTVLDGLLAGLTPVVLEGRNFRSLQGAGMMRELGMGEMVGRNVDEYVGLAVRLGTDAGFREAVKRKIGEAMGQRPRFLDVEDYGARIGGAVERAWAETRNPKPE
jgi:predicted O-linked N-acetylglucosamine transferase (SPINDLY family)